MPRKWPYFSWQINNLAIADITNDDVQIITENIGRCIKTKDENTVVFVHKLPDFGY